VGSPPRLLFGDCLDAMREMAENSVDAVVTDPPYGLEFMGKEWDRLTVYGGITDGNDSPHARRHSVSFIGSPNPTCRKCGGLKNLTSEGSGGRKKCRCEQPDFPMYHVDAGHAMQEWHLAWAREAFRVLKPGGHLVAFGGTRTYHRLACALEDAGFEIRDQLQWIYASGFPKGRRIDNALFQETRRWLSSANVQRVEQLSKHIRLPSNGAREPTALAAARIQPEGAPVLLMEIGRAGGSSEVMAILLSPSEAENIASNTTLSWNEGSAEDYAVMSKSTTATESETTIATRIWNSIQSHRTSANAIPPNVSLADGSTWPACIVVKSLNGGGSKSQGIPILTALGDAMWNPVVRHEGFNVALKPAHEPICLARKPLSESTVAANVLRWATGAINVDGCRIGYESGGSLASNPSLRSSVKGGHGGHILAHEEQSREMIPHLSGRWPANVVLGHHPECVLRGAKRVKSTGGSQFDGDRSNATHDMGLARRVPRVIGGLGGLEEVEDWACHPECPVRLLDEQSGELFSGRLGPGMVDHGKDERTYGAYAGRVIQQEFGNDRGGASRFFYCAKADNAERGEFNRHPTLKPVALMCWLCRLVTPPGGTILDPFMGSGSTGVAALAEGFGFVGVEREAEYFAVARRRIAKTSAGSPEVSENAPMAVDEVQVDLFAG